MLVFVLRNFTHSYWKRGKRETKKQKPIFYLHGNHGRFSTLVDNHLYFVLRYHMIRVRDISNHAWTLLSQNFNESLSRRNLCIN